MSDVGGDHIQQKAQARMNRIDALPKDVRELVHEYGYSVIDAFLCQGVTKASAIKHLIQRVKTGSIDPGTGKGSAGWVHAGRTMAVVPLEPTPAMIEASMAEVSGGNVTVDKYEKHKLRLRAALRVGMSRLA